MSSKRRINPVWIAVIFGSAVFLFYQYFMADKTDEALTMEDARDEVASTGEATAEQGDLERLPQVDAYLRYVAENNPEDDGTFDQNYTKGAFNHLTNALKDLAEQKETSLETSRIEVLQDQFDQYEQAEDPAKPEQLKNVLMATIGMIQALQQDNSEGLQQRLETLRNQAEAIDTETPLEEQGQYVEEYFEQAALALQEVERSI